MKKIHVTIISLFLIILILPLCFFDLREDAVSETDNRMLAENPFGSVHSAGDLSGLGDGLKAYVSDRIGFRKEAISAYQALNQHLFSVMDHPYYMKGREGYVFMRKNSNVVFSDYHRRFADMIIEIDRYCKARNVPFLFVFEPEKLSIMREYAPPGLNYEDGWVDEFLGILRENGVRCVNNTEILNEKYQQGEHVFNDQYDAGHWNDIGAFYGVNYILEHMREDDPDIHINTLDEFTCSEDHQVDLQQLGVLVEETTPLYTPKVKPDKLTDRYADQLVLNKDHHYFNYFVNDHVKSPKTLMFQGSYMNTRGYKFMANALNEYIAVHDYENIFDFDYYYNIFEPEYVIFEVAEYTFIDMFFSTERLYDFSLTPPLKSFSDYPEESRPLSDLTISYEKGGSITDITVSGVSGADHLYMTFGEKTYQMRPDGKGGFTLSLLNENVQGQPQVTAASEGQKKRYLYR